MTKSIGHSSSRVPNRSSRFLFVVHCDSNDLFTISIGYTRT